MPCPISKFTSCKINEWHKSCQCGALRVRRTRDLSPLYSQSSLSSSGSVNLCAGMCCVQPMQSVKRGLRTAHATCQKGVAYSPYNLNKGKLAALIITPGGWGACAVCARTRCNRSSRSLQLLIQPYLVERQFPRLRPSGQGDLPRATPQAIQDWRLCPGEDFGNAANSDSVSATDSDSARGESRPPTCSKVCTSELVI